MASFKEVKNRILSVSNTRKITSAMKMVASSKLHKAQLQIESMLPYEFQLNQIMAQFVSTIDGEVSSPYTLKRKTTRVAIIVYASNSSLCGGFNSNIIKRLRTKILELNKTGIKYENIEVFPIGKKVAEAARKLGFSVKDDNSKSLEKPNYADAVSIAQGFMKRFVEGELDEVILIYNHFKSSSQQVLVEENYLPINLDATQKSNNSQNREKLDYIIEPSIRSLLCELIPKALHLKLYTVMLDSLASEHASRVIAMQTATDNADTLLQDLTLMYNKSRQQAITTELLDIVGGSMK
ncbi:MAG: F0F1 ATP synthase subunit gamma [Bacteroidaceae bacterium]